MIGWQRYAVGGGGSTGATGMASCGGRRQAWPAAVVLVGLTLRHQDLPPGGSKVDPFHLSMYLSIYPAVTNARQLYCTALPLAL